MFSTRSKDAPTLRAGELVSRILLQRGDTDSALAVTWVQVAPGSSQAPHRHAPEQVYVIVRGEGSMRVNAEVREVGPGDLVLVPPGARHGIENTGEELLEYVSAATPAFRIADHYLDPA